MPVDRGPEDQWTDSQCDQCGGYYMDCGLPQAQGLHDRDIMTKDCGGKLHAVPDSANAPADRPAKAGERSGL
jgi:hypothetical protein